MKPCLSHQGEQSYRFQGNSLAAGIGSGNDQKVKVLSQVDIDGNHLLPLQERVAPLSDINIVVFIENRLRGVLLHGELGFRKYEVQVRHAFLVGRKFLYMRSSLGTQFGKDDLDFLFLFDL